MRWTTVRRLLASTITLSALTGCSAPSENAKLGETEPGELGLGVQVGSTGIREVNWVVTGKSGFAKHGSVDVSHSSKVATRIGNLPAASGYTIVLSATATEPPATCTGSAGFDVTPGATTPVDLTMECVEVNADFNTCPLIDELSALPNQVAVGGTITLVSTVRDPDSGPTPLSYSWSTTAGSLTSSGKNAALLCTAAGTAVVTLQTTDGGTDCSVAQSVTVTCGNAPPAEVAQQAPVPLPFAALLAAQLLALGVHRGRRKRVG
jgi:hypothetical protein